MTNTHWNTEKVRKAIEDKLAGETYNIEVDDPWAEDWTPGLRFMRKRKSIFVVTGSNHGEDLSDSPDDCTIELVLIQLHDEEDTSEEDQELFDKVKRLLKHELKFTVVTEQDDCY